MEMFVTEVFLFFFLFFIHLFCKLIRFGRLAVAQAPSVHAGTKLNIFVIEAPDYVCVFLNTCLPSLNVFHTIKSLN